MHFGVSVPNNFGVESMRELVEFAVTAEELGYQSAWVSDQLFHASYVAARLGNRPYHEALTVLSVIAARTESVNLGTSVLVLPWHQPVRLAKVLASLDQLSGGRVIVGVGVGNAKDEFEALGVPFEERGRIVKGDIDRDPGTHWRVDATALRPIRAQLRRRVRRRAR